LGLKQIVSFKPVDPKQNPDPIVVIHEPDLIIPEMATQPKGALFSDQYFDYFYQLQNAFKNRFPELEFAAVCNRFRNEGTKCVAKTRVNTENVLLGNRIHANHVRFESIERPFICSQAPLDESEEAFWLGVMENSSVIVDLTNPGDFDKGVHAYYPMALDQEKNVGTVKVRLIGIEGSIHTYQCMVEGQAKQVRRLSFAEWPDFGVVELEQFKQLLESIRQVHRQNKDSLWTHCRAGLGRTGAAVVGLAIQELHAKNQMTAENYRDVIDELIIQGRSQRDSMFVQTAEQYRLLLLYAENLLGIDQA
jgi:protein tyrosine phosphatase